MITKLKPISLVEVKDIIKGYETSESLKEHIKRFDKLDMKKAKDIEKDIENLNNIKIKDENTVKIIELLPQDSEDVNKIFVDVSLNEEEVNAILEIVKKY